MRVLFVFGTRPEAIKLCPVVRRLAVEREWAQVRVCVTAQHREMLDQVLAVFGVRPDWDLDLMRPGQSLFESTSRIVAGLEPVLREEKPDLVVVQGDTTTTLCGALAAFYMRVPVAHVEAGLRTGDMQQPFPEEMNRVLTSRLAALHFAATARAAQNLVLEGVPRDRILVTGNTVIDAVLDVARRLEQGELTGLGADLPQDGRKLIVVTAHRRESFGRPLERICEALVRLARRGDVRIVYPVHPNPNVSGPVRRLLGGVPYVELWEPLEYVGFVDLLRRAYLVVTDSGGIQEEGPSLGKPILVLREKTERPEAVEVGTVRLVGTDPDRIVAEATRLLEDEQAYARMARIHNPYGDGRASERIVAGIRSFWEGKSLAGVPEFRVS